MGLEIRCLPTEDRTFRRAVGQALAGLTVIDAERVLRHAVAALDPLAEQYPNLRIRMADAMASAGGDTVLYVFRDGDALPPANEGPGAMGVRAPLARASGR